MRIAIFCSVVGFLSAAALANPITFTESATATGTLGTSTFTNALVTITVVGDTTDVTNPSPGIFHDLALSPATVTVAGIGMATFSDTIAAVVNQNLSAGGISDLTSNLLILFTSNSSFSTYSLGSSTILAGTATINSGDSFATNEGNLALTSVSGNSTFTAGTSGVPEPSSMALLSIGLLGLAGRALRKRLS